tara:strand:- start:1896 stop:2057 length:162 start_codon:yes stop_codon:yes gene_type:complete
MKRQFVRVIITANDDRGKAETWLKAAIENDLKSGESILTFDEMNLDGNDKEVD